MKSTKAGTTEREMLMQADGALLRGDLCVPANACGLVLFAHGSGSGRKSPRNRHVADVLNKHGLATLLMDLLTHSEEEIDAQTRRLRFDIGLLTDRLTGVTNWVSAEAELHGLRIGYFGASTGAAAALAASTHFPNEVHAVVSRGGRPDLASAALEKVSAPTLLLVGSLDDLVIQLNQQAMEHMHNFVHVEIVPGASHLFEEPRKLDIVADHSARWFAKYLCGDVRSSVDLL